MALWFLSLAAQRISSPVSQFWAHAGQGESSQENLCWCQQWKHHHPSSTSHNICQTAVCPFFLSLSTSSLLSPRIFPSYWCTLSEILNPCWQGVSHFTWLVVSAGTLVALLSIGLLGGRATLGVSFKVLSTHVCLPQALHTGKTFLKSTKELQTRHYVSVFLLADAPAKMYLCSSLCNIFSSVHFWCQRMAGWAAAPVSNYTVHWVQWYVLPAFHVADKCPVSYLCRFPISPWCIVCHFFRNLSHLL